MAPKPDLAELVHKHLRAKTAAKRYYDRADRFLAEIAEHIEPGDEIKLNDSGKKAVLLDNFAGKTIVWGHGGVRKYEIEILDS